MSLYFALYGDESEADQHGETFLTTSTSQTTWHTGNAEMKRKIR